MAYEKTTWMTGDTITAEKMNRIEDQLEALSESSGNTNDITVTLDNANKKYLLGTTTQPAAIATSMTIVADSNTYLDATGLKVQGSLASGDGCVTDGANSHAEGQKTKAKGNYSHAEGVGTIAGLNQHVSGKYNIEDNSNIYAEIVGNGTADNDRKNARTLDWEGNEWLAGSLALGQKLTFNNQETPYINLKTPGVAQLGICTDDIFLTRATQNTPDDSTVVDVTNPSNYEAFNFSFDDLAKLRILCDHYDQIMQLVNPPENNVEVTEPDNP